MARLTTDRLGWGAVDHPETGELIQIGESINREDAEAVAHAYDETRVLYEDSDRPESDEADESEDYTCGVNGCSRSVDSEDATCWQH